MMSIDIRTITPEQCEMILTDPEFHHRHHGADVDEQPRSYFECAIDAFVESGPSPVQRLIVLQKVVHVTLEHWDEIVRIGRGRFPISVNPLSCIPRIAHVKQAADHDLMEFVLRLWDRATESGDLTSRAVIFLAEGLGAHVPLTNDQLVDLYRTHFTDYSRIALAILCARGERDRARCLFEENIARYGNNADPSTMDDLVRDGLPFESVKMWLDQSVNAEEGYAKLRSDAIVRWRALAKKYEQTASV